jgi:hypothetical protein
LALRNKKMKTLIIIISVFISIAVIMGAIWGVELYLQNKKIQEEQQKIIQEHEKYSAQNFDDKSSNYENCQEIPKLLLAR